MNKKSEIMNSNVQFFIKKFGNTINPKLINSKYSIIDGIRILINEWCKKKHNYDINKINIKSITIFKIMSEVNMSEKFWNEL